MVSEWLEEKPFFRSTSAPPEDSVICRLTSATSRMRFGSSSPMPSDEMKDHVQLPPGAPRPRPIDTVAGRKRGEIRYGPSIGFGVGRVRPSPSLRRHRSPNMNVRRVGLDAELINRAVTCGEGEVGIVGRQIVQQIRQAAEDGTLERFRQEVQGQPESSRDEVSPMEIDESATRPETTGGHSAQAAGAGLNRDGQNIRHQNEPAGPSPEEYEKDTSDLNGLLAETQQHSPSQWSGSAASIPTPSQPHLPRGTKRTRPDSSDEPGPGRPKEERRGISSILEDAVDAS
ncbi:hypothetical protein BJY01DRAFT_247198 [Aspergillus pseudoustus]|uniref:Uncharacterized protein n=1 Tax=Aspergillus pseudoustus TaxID=1810923 RepID=A0ABR4K260_9EURO